MGKEMVNVPGRVLDQPTARRPNLPIPALTHPEPHRPCGGDSAPAIVLCLVVLRLPSKDRWSAPTHLLTDPPLGLLARLSTSLGRPGYLAMASGAWTGFGSSRASELTAGCAPSPPQPSPLPSITPPLCSP